MTAETISEAGAERATRSRQRGPTLRLLGFARGYLGLILLAVILSAGYSGTRYLRAYLIKPLLDDVVLPGAVVAEGTNESWLPPLSGEHGPRLKNDSSPANPGADSTANRAAEIRSDFLSILTIAGALILSMPILLFARTYVIEFVLGRIHVEIKQSVCTHLLALPLRYHENQRRGELISRTMADVDTAHAAFSLGFGSILQSAVGIAVGMGFLCSISWRLTAGCLVLGPAIFAIISLFGQRIRHSARRRQEKLADVTQRLVEILSGIKIIKAFGAERSEDAAFRRETNQLFKRSMRVVRNRVVARSLIEMINSTVGVGVIAIGALLVTRGWWGLSAGDLAAFAAVMGTTYKPVKDLSRGFVRIADAQPAAARFFSLLDEPARRRDSPDALPIHGVERGIRLDQVSFSYGREPVLRDISLDIGAGQVTALVGPTGAGKTTLTDLLLGFYDPTSGRIEIDGVDLRDIQRESLLAQIAVVTQEPFLFDGSVRDNLTYGRPGASDEEILAAARAAHVDEFASQLPRGYDTEVGGGGVKLSGGQRQRITIARALLKDPAILVFDEATSSLDAKSERLVQEATFALFGGRRTVLVITHRLSTIRRADRIVVLDGGRIVQDGTHADLLSQPGLYRELVNLQMERDPA